MVFQRILDVVAATPLEFTYLGIGSAPHAETVAELDDAWDQLVPVFVRDKADKTVRIIHFDPSFSRRIDFVKTYFATKYPHLVYRSTGSYHQWSSPRFDSSAPAQTEWLPLRMEITIVESAVEYKSEFYESDENHEWFLEALSTSVLKRGGQLVVADFTGRTLDALFKRIYDKSPDKALFKRKILFDVTYGNASCMTDLTKDKPIYDANGDFANFLAFSPLEMIEAIGKNKRLDELIRNFCVKKFAQILNFHHVNYRRRMKGDTCMNPCNSYTDESSADTVMMVLQNELTDVFHILKELGSITAEKEHEFRHLMKYYDQMNMYDWGTAVGRLI